MVVSSRFAVVAALAAALLAVGGTAHAEGDPVRGKALTYSCLGCHGVENYKNVYPTYSVPKLQGQHPEYIVIALRAYKSGERSHGTMHAQAASMTEQDFEDIAAFFAGEPLQPTGQPPGDVPEAAAVCVSCHGSDGVGILPEYPTIAGQHADYIARSLAEYKNGARRNPIMIGFATALSEADMAVLAEYYARQKPGLETLDRHASRFTVR